MGALALNKFALALLLTGTVAASGCVDPRERLDEFSDRVGDAPGGDGDGDTSGDGDGDNGPDLPDGTAADVTGRFVVGLELSNLAPGTPLRLIADVVYTGDDTGGTIDLTFFPLDRQGLFVDSDRNPGEDAAIATMSDVTAEGRFDSSFTDGEVPAAANVITNSPIGLTFNDLEQVILSADGFCGLFTDGVSSTGTPLEGTVAGFRVADDAVGNQLPAIEDLAYNCDLLCDELELDCGGE